MAKFFDCRKVTLGIILLIALGFIFVCPNSAYATDINGSYGGVDWTITSDYDLIIGKSGETQVFNGGDINDSWREDIHTVMRLKTATFVGDVIWNGSLENMFKDCVNLTSIDLRGLDTTQATSMKNMFRECQKLSEIDVSKFSTANVADMSYMFFRCYKLSAIDVSGFNTSKVTDMAGMFCGCNILKAIDVSGFNTSQVTDMAGMFYDCNILTAVDVSGFNTSNVTNMSTMFYDCEALSALDVSGFNTAKVTDMTGMFNGCKKLSTIDVSGFDTSRVTGMRGMFSWCTGLTTLDVSNFNTQNVTDMGCMFYVCSNVSTLDVSNFDTSKVTDMFAMFINCYKLTTADVSNFNTDNVIYMQDMFCNCKLLSTIDVSKFNTRNVESFSGMFLGCNSVGKLDVSNFKTSNATSMANMFSGCRRITELNLSSFDTSNVTSMANMFSSCRSLKSLDISGFNTRNVTVMNGMFAACSSLTSLDVSKLKTSKVTEMSGMFSECDGLTALDVSKLDTSSVVDMSGMFSGCDILESITFGSFDTSSVTDMNEMFESCRKLSTVNVSKFDTQNVENMCDMFAWCTGLTTIDLSNFVTTKTTDMRLFYECGALETLKVGNWDYGAMDYKPTFPKTMYNSASGAKYEAEATIPEKTACTYISTYNGGSIDPVDPDDPADPEVYYGPVTFGNHTYVKNLDYYAENLGTSQFNKNLCALMCGLSCSAYSYADVGAAYKELGFTNNEFARYNYPENTENYNDIRAEISYTIGKKTNENGTTIILIDIRGTDIKNLSDIFHDIAVTGLDNDYSVHQGFQIGSDMIMSRLERYLMAEPEYDPDVKYFVTGHSLGAAVGNLFAAKLSSYVGKGSVYNYNFACPDTTVSKTSALDDPYAFNQQNCHSNMFNICRASDIVTYVPGLAGSMLLEAKEKVQYGWDVLQAFHTDADYYWGKFGIAKWFDDGIIGLDAHDQNNYLNYVCRSNATFANANNYRDAFTQAVNNAFIFCPVDAELVDSNGAVVASIANNEPTYVDDSFGEVIIQTCDDKKCISYPAGKGYSLRLKATDSGTMDFILARGTPDSTKFDAAKVYQNATLSNGKEMAHQGAEGSTITDSKLTILDTDGNVTAEIKEDGSETAIPPAGGGSSGGGSTGGGGGASGDTPSTDPTDDDQAAADAVIKAINDLPATITLENEAAVVAARTAYAALTEAQKALVSAEILAKLEQAEATITNWQQYNTNVAAAKNATSKIIKVKNQKLRKAIITWQNTDGCTGCTIAYTTDKKFKKGIKRKTIKAGTTKLTLKKLKKGKTYYFKVQPYTDVTNQVTGETTTVAGKWSKAKKLKIKR